MAPRDQAPAAQDDREQSVVNIDPDFYVPSGAEGTNRYLRALRLLLPRS